MMAWVAQWQVFRGVIHFQRLDQVDLNKKLELGKWPRFPFCKWASRLKSEKEKAMLDKS